MKKYNLDKLNDADLECIKDLFVHEYYESSRKAAKYREVLAKMGYMVMNGYEYPQPVKADDDDDDNE